MKRGHAFLISLAVAVALLFGIVAARHTAQLAHSSSQQAQVSPAELAVRNRVLSREEAKLRRILRERPRVSRRLAAAQVHRVLYVRAKPHIVTVHRAQGGESETEGREHEGGEFDD